MAPRLAGIIVIDYGSVTLGPAGGFTFDANVLGFEDPSVPGNVQNAVAGSSVFGRDFTAEQINTDLTIKGRAAAVADFVPPVTDSDRFLLINPIDERVIYDWRNENFQT